MKAVRVLLGIASLGFGAAMSIAGARAGDLTVAGWGGGLQDAQRAAYFTPFAQQKQIKVQEDVYLGGWAKFKAMQETKNYVWDIVNVESSEMQRGCDEGLFLKLDWSKMGGGKANFIPAAVSDCGVGSYVWAFALAYNADVIKEAPTSIADLWNTAKWPGKRGMRKGPHFNLELALLADGVPAAQIYKVLSTKEGVDRAFRKLDGIKSQIIWWEAPAQTPELLASGDVVMTIAPNARITAANKAGKNFKLVYQPGLIGVDFWVALKNSPNAALASEFLQFVSDPKRQAAFSSSFAYAPTNRQAEALLSPAVAAELPVGEKVAGGLDTGSAEANQFWADRGEELNERWNAWLK